MTQIVSQEVERYRPFDRVWALYSDGSVTYFDRYAGRVDEIRNARGERVWVAVDKHGKRCDRRHHLSQDAAVQAVVAVRRARVTELVVRRELRGGYLT